MQAVYHHHPQAYSNPQAQACHKMREASSVTAAGRKKQLQNIITSQNPKNEYETHSVEPAHREHNPMPKDAVSCSYT